MAEPVISYPGAKWRFYTHMKKYFPLDMKDFREPFFGGGSVSLSVADDPDFTKLERIQVGDLAPEIWAMWTGIRNNAPDVVEIVHKWFEEKCPLQIEVRNADPFSPEYEDLYNRAIEQGREFWKWSQTVDCSTLSIPERAARTFLVNKISFSGMGDSGSISKDQFMDFKVEKTKNILLAQPLLQRMEINNVSFEDTMSNVDPKNTFIFLDPPYYRQESSGLYGKHGGMHRGFPHEHFAEFTRNTNCKWFITYDDSVKVRKMFRGSAIYGGKCYVTPFKIPGGYTLAGKTAEDALDGEEVIITNYPIEQTEDEDL